MDRNLPRDVFTIHLLINDCSSKSFKADLKCSCTFITVGYWFHQNPRTFKALKIKCLIFPASGGEYRLMATAWSWETSVQPETRHLFIPSHKDSGSTAEEEAKRMYALEYRRMAGKCRLLLKALSENQWWLLINYSQCFHNHLRLFQAWYSIKTKRIRSICISLVSTNINIMYNIHLPKAFHKILSYS